MLSQSIGPGYAVNLEMNMPHRANTNELGDLEILIRSIALKEDFRSIKIESKKDEGCSSYYRELSGNEFKHITKYKGISLVYCLELEESDRAEKSQSINTRITLFNHWKGQENSIKLEIDRIADVLRKELEKRYDIVLHVQNIRTGPPF
jgi:hypothetical protein